MEFYVIPYVRKPECHKTVTRGVGANRPPLSLIYDTFQLIVVLTCISKSAYVDKDGEFTYTETDQRKEYGILQGRNNEKNFCKQD